MCAAKCNEGDAAMSGDHNRYQKGSMPPQREWQGLTDGERYLGDARSEEEIEYAKAIEAKLREKNGGK